MPTHYMTSLLNPFKIFRDLMMIGPQLERVPAQEEFVETRLVKLRTQYCDLRDLLLGYAAGIDNAFPHAVHPRDIRLVRNFQKFCVSHRRLTRLPYDRLIRSGHPLFADAPTRVTGGFPDENREIVQQSCQQTVEAVCVN